MAVAAKKLQQRDNQDTHMCAAPPPPLPPVEFKDSNAAGLTFCDTVRCCESTSDSIAAGLAGASCIRRVLEVSSTSAIAEIGQNAGHRL